MNNAIELLKMIKNPKEYVVNYAKSSNNPILNNLISEAEKGNNKAVETFANNVFKEKGIDINELMKLIK